MNRSIHALLALPFFFSALLSTAFAQPGTSESGEILHDPSMNREADRGFKQERERWMKEMHRADPGVNVDVLNQQIRNARYILHEKNGSRALAADGEVHIAGNLFGYWNERGSNNQAGRTHSADIDFESGQIYVAADGGQLWRGTLEGQDWTSLNDQMRFGTTRMVRVVRTQDRKRLLVVNARDALRSDDEGLTWTGAQGLEDLQRSGNIQRAVLTDGPERILYAIGQQWDFDRNRWTGVLYRSTNFGETFTNVMLFDDTRCDVWAPYGKDLVYVIYGDSLVSIAPGSEPRVMVGGIVPDEGSLDEANGLNLRGKDAGEMYLLAAQNRGTVVYVTPDSGRSWIRTGTTTSMFTRNSADVSPSNSGFAITGGVETMYTLDAGFTWDTVNKWGEYYANPATRLHADIPFIKFFIFPDGTEQILISTDGGLYISRDSLRTVRNLMLSGMGNSQYYSVYTSRVDTNYIFAGAQDQGFQRADLDHGGVLDFAQTISGDYGHISSGDGGVSLWTNYPGFSMYYSNALRNDLGWGRRTDFPTKGHLWLPPILADPDTPNVAYLAGGGIDGGAHLVKMKYFNTGDIQAEELPFDFSDGGNGPINAVAISPVNTNYWYVHTNDNQFYTSTDRGESWTLTEDFDGPDGHYFYGVSLVPSRRTTGVIYLGGAGYSSSAVWVSRDNGQTFEAMDEGLPPTLVYDLDVSADDKLLFAATAVGPYVFVADSGKWYDAAGLMAPDQTYWSVEYLDENNLARFGTYGRGIWDLRLVEVITGVDEESTTAGPVDLKLTGVHGAGTTAMYTLELPQSGDVTLQVFDLTGRVVAVLHSGLLEAGTHTFIWDGTAGGSSPVPSGQYFCVASGLGTIAYATTSLER